MTRYYATQSVPQIRTEERRSMQESVHLHNTSILLDKIEAAEDVVTLRTLLAEFVKTQTGVQ